MIKARQGLIYHIRVRLGYTQKKLAEKVDISTSMMSQLERGERNPGPAVAYRLYKALDVTFDELFYTDQKNLMEAHHNDEETMV